MPTSKGRVGSRASARCVARAGAFALVFALVGCGGGTPPPPPRPTPGPLLAARPYSLQVPGSYSATTASSLVLALHGYGATGLVQAQYFGLLAGSEKHGYLLAYPDGTT